MMTGYDVAQPGLELAVAPQVGAVQAVTAHYTEGAQTVLDAAPEIDRRSFCKIAGGHCDLADAESESDRLSDDFGVKNEVVGVEHERDRFQQLPAVSAEATVHLG